jgi:hypothetical protein
MGFDSDYSCSSNISSSIMTAAPVLASEEEGKQETAILGGLGLRER